MAAFGGPAGLLISVYYGVWGPLDPGESHAWAVVSNVISFAVFAVLFVVVVQPRVFSRVDSALEWWVEGRHPDESEQRRVLALPVEVAQTVVRFLLVVAVLVTIGNYVSQRYADEAARVFVGLVLTAFMVGAIAYLIVERALRPAFAAALAAGTDVARPIVGVRARLLLAWALGSGIPLLFVLAIPLGYTRSGPVLPMEVPVVFMAVLGLSTGLVITSLVSRSVADPIEGVREAMRRVREGDVEASVPVDDGGEIGLLQSGFNDMVAGLRERRRIEDLFGRHVGEDVARNALARGVALGGETRDITALFVDLVGSTAMTEALAPTQVVSTLNSFFDAVVESVSVEGGWVNKFEGDGALCVFGAPVDDADHAAHGLRAARALRSALVGIGLDAGIGVSSGEAVAGNVGTERRYEYTVIGRPVNEAARLTDEAKRRPSKLLASERTVGAAGAEAGNWRSAERLALRGLSEPLPVSEPVG